LPSYTGKDFASLEAASCKSLINTDKNIIMHAALSTWIEAGLYRLLDRFDSHLARIDVFLTDEYPKILSTPNPQKPV
jgi:hypothetical protein